MKINYPVVVITTFKYPEGEDPIYLAKNDEQLKQSLKAIALDYKLYDEHIFNEVYNSGELKELYYLLNVNKGDSFFGAEITVTTPKQL